MRLFSSALFSLFAVLFYAGCATTTTNDDGGPARAAMLEAIRQEQPGNYFIGRRYYKVDYKMWGFVRKPGESWGQSQLVMMNEQKKLAPDRELGQLGSDHGYEYKLLGYYSGQTVYEPASNGFYPEFVLTGYELRNVSPAPIFHDKATNNPTIRIIGKPY